MASEEQQPFTQTTHQPFFQTKTPVIVWLLGVAPLAAAAVLLIGYVAPGTRELVDLAAAVSGGTRGRIQGPASVYHCRDERRYKGGEWVSSVRSTRADALTVETPDGARRWIVSGETRFLIARTDRSRDEEKIKLDDRELKAGQAVIVVPARGRRDRARLIVGAPADGIALRVVAAAAVTLGYALLCLSLLLAAFVTRSRIARPHRPGAYIEPGISAAFFSLLVIIFSSAGLIESCEGGMRSAAWLFPTPLICAGVLLLVFFRGVLRGGVKPVAGGVVVAEGDEPVFRVKQRMDGAGRTSTDCEHRPFEVDGGEDQVHVEPSDLTIIDVPSPAVRMEGKLRVTEAAVHPRDEVLVFGGARQGQTARPPDDAGRYRAPRWIATLWDADRASLVLSTRSLQDWNHRDRRLRWLGLGAGLAALALAALDIAWMIWAYGAVTAVGG